MKTYALHLCDDHPILAISLAEKLQCEQFVQSTSVSHSIDELKEFLASNKVDLLLLDISFKGDSVFDVLQSIQESYPGLKIVLLTNYELSDVLIEARKFNVHGLIGKSVSFEELKVACITVLSGKAYWGKMQISELTLNELTSREREILKLLVQGNTNQQISEELSISIYTVQTHRKNIKSKLQVEGVADLIAIVNRYRLV